LRDRDEVEIPVETGADAFSGVKATDTIAVGDRGVKTADLEEDEVEFGDDETEKDETTDEAGDLAVGERMGGELNTEVCEPKLNILRFDGNFRFTNPNINPLTLSLSTISTGSVSSISDGSLMLKLVVESFGFRVQLLDPTLILIGFTSTLIIKNPLRITKDFTGPYLF
jgi:hypothetical protein